MTLLVFLGGPSWLEGVGIISACPKVWTDFKTDVCKDVPLIVITFIPFPTYQVLRFACSSRSTKFEYSFHFPSAFPYFTRLFMVKTGEVLRIVYDVSFDLIDVAGIVNKRKSPIC